MIIIRLISIFRAKSKRKLLQPNHGFIQQLKMFHKMGFKIDPEYKSYKIFRLKLAAEQVKSGKLVTDHYRKQQCINQMFSNFS